MDGELVPAESMEVERLLARSEDARVYLQELHAVRELSGEAFVAPHLAGASGSSLAEKLSGRSVQSAAKQAVVGKSVVAGSWGVAGVIGVAAAVVGIILFFGDGEPRPAPVAADRSSHSTGGVIQPHAQPTMNLDTSNLLVPPMTPSDLLTFAVDGTLPIDARHGCYITLGSTGMDSLSVEVHAKAPASMAEQLPSLDGTAMVVLDSIQRVVRTSLLQYSNERIALRTDMPRLRLDVIRSFEKVAPHLPAQVREKLDQSRSEILAAQRAAGEREDSHVGAGVGGGRKPARVPYTVVAFDGAGDASIHIPQVEDRIVINSGQAPVMIDEGDLLFLQQCIPLPPSVPSFFKQERREIVVNTSPSGVRVQRSERRRERESLGAAAGAAVVLEERKDSDDGRLLPRVFDQDDVLILGQGDSILQQMPRTFLQMNGTMHQIDSIIQSIQGLVEHSVRWRRAAPKLDSSDGNVPLINIQIRKNESSEP